MDGHGSSFFLLTSVYKLTLQTQLLPVDAQADRMTDLTFIIRLVLLIEWDDLQGEALTCYHQ